MSKFSVPAGGIQLQRSILDPKSIPQIVRLDLPAKELEDILKGVRDGATSRFKTGRAPELIVGPKHLPLRPVVADKSTQELFTGSLDGSAPIYFTGKLSHTLEVRQAREATAGVDEALALLKHNLKQANDDRSQTEVNSLTNKLLKPQHRPSPLSAGLLGSRPSSPFLSAGFSPRTGPTSAPLLPGQSKEDKVRLAAIKIPIIHLLAIEPQDPKYLMKTLRVKKSDFDQVISKVAQESEGGKKKLKDRAYRELDVWKFPYRLQHDRQAAIDHAISAFDRQRIDSSDNLWQMLLAKEDRNKGIKLSRLNFDKPLLTGNLTPRIPERSTDGGSTEGKSTKSAISESANKKGKAPIVKKTETQAKAKTVVNNHPKTARDITKPTQPAQAVTKPKDNGSKKEVKYISSEKVENSDEEANAGPSITVTISARPQDTKPTKPAKPVVTSKSASQQSQTTSITSQSNEVNRGRLTPNSAMVRTRGGKETTNTATNGSKLSTVAGKSLPSSQSGTTRPRHGSSPAKPSPLGSSPPNNARDNDSSSTSSKGTALSSAPSTPPTTNHAPQPSKKAYAPAIVEKKAEKLTNGNKRKADEQEDGPPVKKQHLVNGKTGSNQANGLPKTLREEVDSAPSKRASPESDTSSSGDKLISRDEVIDKAKDFQRYYGKYKALHERLNSTPVNDRDDADIDKLWTMHQRLSQIKDQIWRDWEKVEGSEKS